MSEEARQLLIQKIGKLNTKLDEFDQRTAELIQEAYDRLKNQPEEVMNAEIQRLSDERRMMKIINKVEVQKYMKILENEANMRKREDQAKDQIVQQLSIIKKYERVYSHITTLEGLLSTPNLSDEMRKDIESQIDTLLYERGLNIEKPASDKEKDKKRTENIDGLAKKIEGLYVGLNSIYGNINEDIFKEDMAVLKNYQEKLDRRKGVKIKETLKDYSSLVNHVKEAEGILKKDPDLMKKVKELEDKKRLLEVQKRKVADMGDPQKEYDDILKKKPVNDKDKKAAEAAKEKLNRFKKLNAQNEKLESEISALEGETAALKDIGDIIRGLLIKLGIKDEKGDPYQFEFSNTLKALDTIQNNKRNQGLDQSYMRGQRAVVNQILEKYDIVVPPAKLPKNYSYVEALNQQRAALEARKKRLSRLVQPGWEEAGTKKINLEKEEEKTVPPVEPKNEPKVGPRNEPKAEPKPGTKSAQSVTPEAAPALPVGTPSQTETARIKPTDDISDTYVPIHIPNEEKGQDGVQLPKRETQEDIGEPIESCDRNLSRVIDDPDSRKIEGGYLYRVIDNGQTIIRKKEDIEYYAIGTDKKLENEIKKIGEELGNLPREKRKELLNSLGKDSVAYQMLAAKNPITRYAARKSFISEMNQEEHANLEMLLTLKASVKPEEKVDCLKRMKGNIFQYGFSDLKDVVKCEPKKGIFGNRKNQYTMKEEAYQDNRKYQEAQRELEEAIRQFDYSKDDRNIRRGPSQDRVSRDKASKDKMSRGKSARGKKDDMDR